MFSDEAVHITYSCCLVKCDVIPINGTAQLFEWRTELALFHGQSFLPERKTGRQAI